MSYETTVASPTPPMGLSRGSRWFLCGLLVVTVLYGGLIAYHGYRLAHPEKVVAQEFNWLEACREACLAYGLIPTGNVRKDAEAYVAAARKQPLSEPMISILDDFGYEIVPTQEHPLIGKPAPTFTLPNHLDEPQSLEPLRDGGPIVVVYYYGYGCSHCVAQLIAIDQELDYFRQLGARVVAISADAPAKTREKYAEYGEFHFPVLADQQDEFGRLYGTVIPATETAVESRDHGTFVIDSQGIVRWAYRGPTPFLDNKSLLLVLAEAEGIRRPKPAKAAASKP